MTNKTLLAEISNAGPAKRRPNGRAATSLTARLSYQAATLAALIDRQSVRILQQHKLNLVEWRIMTSVEATSPCTLTDLIPLVAVDRALVSREISRLHERGYVMIEADPDDGRRKLISLTKAGEACHARALIDMLKRQSGLAGVLTKAEREVFEIVVSKLKMAILARTGE